ncbi:helix-turn-helix domain-containing protein [Hamadaea tsunoensis]|uniref:helix-turn-helix domain-containing protein n=1 Tax=Hamadaea tsunoensis TaxID=53368 RepID=UPI00042001BF|nr:helix-turn-helix transcriptional regulator [Hamadaea tsunoensis]
MDELATNFGTALRAWRRQVAPAEVGLPGGGDRRVPGLRREEVASIAGLSVDYLVRLEQGRASAPSPQTVEALARALRLGAEQRSVLYHLAGAAEPNRARMPRAVPTGVERLIGRLGGQPSAVFTADWTLLRWNTLWAAVHGDPSAWDGHDRNLIWRHFTDRRTCIVRSADELTMHDRELVGDLRVAHARYPHDRGVAGLISDLYAHSAQFRDLWSEFAVLPARDAAKAIEHPLVGRIDLDCQVLWVSGAELRLIVYSAEPGSASATALAKLAGPAADTWSTYAAPVHQGSGPSALL